MEGAIQQAPQSGRQFISSDSLQAISVQKIWQGYNSLLAMQRFCSI